MRKTGVIFSLVLLAALPLAILLLSSNASLRLPQTYGFYFNDDQTVAKAGLNVDSDDAADEIGKYINSFGGEPIQIYEDNGEYRDPVFTERDQDVMARARGFVRKETVFGAAALILAVVSYSFAKKDRKALLFRVCCWLAASLSAAGLVLRLVLLNSGSFRTMLFHKLIGIGLKKGSGLDLLWGSGFAKAYLVFATVIGLILLAAAVLIYRSGRPKKGVFLR